MNNGRSELRTEDMYGYQFGCGEVAICRMGCGCVATLKFPSRNMDINMDMIHQFYSFYERYLCQNGMSRGF